ncbi:MAG: hydantoinase/oxoprolinase family protein [Chloroflexi bacterium]|nr:hydantoinase/oxoprolinase family protein [Chloroflexota bacterium]
MTLPQPPNNIRIGIDIGGTFTDFVIFDPATKVIQTFKIPSTPPDPSIAVIEGMERIRNQFSGSNLPTSYWIIHGSTVATNALLERKGDKTALVTTRGFKDIIQIGRQNRPELYAFSSKPVPPLVLETLRFEVDERVDYLGDISTPIDETQVDEIVKSLTNLKSDKVNSIAIVFLFSFANPNHELLVAEKFRQAGFFVSASHEILPEYREYERASTTVINAYVSPILDRYLSKLKNSLTSATKLQIMQSNGGCISLDEARKAGVRCILSGPAGGVVGSQYVGQIASPDSSLKLLTFDMGGTSTDVALIDGQPKITSEASVGGHPIRIPLLDIHTIGAGGGSIASIDAGGALRVGPESAGADPGPACYGRDIGSQPRPATVTDANLHLGRIPADYFLGGQMSLYPALAQEAIKSVAEKLGLSPTQTALGIIEIANAHMERALRVISVERGHDPRNFTLLSFGGAGSLHAADLARQLNIPRVLVPPYASTLSAFGMLAADVIKDYTKTIMLPSSTPHAEINQRISQMVAQGRVEIAAEGFSEQDIQIEEALDIRYRGQSYELTIPFSVNFIDAFHQEHNQTYGYHRPEASLEVVNLRVRAFGVVRPPQISAQPLGDTDPAQARFDSRRVVYPSGEVETPFYQAESLNPGNIIPGPAVIVRSDTTILLSQSDQARVDPYNNIIIEVAR